MCSKSEPSKLRVRKDGDKYGGSSCCYFPMLIFFIITAVVSWYFSREYITPPKPNIDLEEWWGSYPIYKTDTNVRPYDVEFPDMILNDLRERLLHRGRFTAPLETTGKYGFNTYFLNRVLDFWQNSYNFEERQRFFNKYPHYTTNIQGLDIHYIHVKPNIPANRIVIPILLIHNWPTSIREFYEIIPLLTTDRPEENFVFEVIVPSLPGFGFSEAPKQEGMGPIKIAVVLHNLIKRIGYDKYCVHGGDFGQSIGSAMATLFPDDVIGFHTNMPFVTLRPYVYVMNIFNWFYTSLVKEDDSLSKQLIKYLENSGYIKTERANPDTTGIALAESPAGLAAYILEKFSIWTRFDKKTSTDGGLLDSYSLTQLIDNIMIYWITNSATASMRIYAQNTEDMYIMDQIPTDTPTAGIKFLHEVVSPDYLLKNKYKTYFDTTVVMDSGHFPAMQHPKILADDLYHFARKLYTIKKNIPSQMSSEPDAEETEKIKAQETSEVHKAPEPEELIESHKPEKTVYDFKVNSINGNPVSLKTYEGKVLIIVNVASQCGYTDTHYKELNELYQKYAEKGLRILAFPCNQFGGQEPGTLKEISQFTQKINVQFDLFEKIDVNGENAHPLWKFLKNVQGGILGDFIKWNFTKFIIDRNGVPVERFGPNVSPLELIDYIEKYL